MDGEKTVISEHTEIVRMLLEHGANVHGMSVIRLPSESGIIECVPSNIALETAISIGNADIVGMLVKYGAMVTPPLKCWCEIREVGIQVCHVIMSHAPTCTLPNITGLS